MVADINEKYFNGEEPSKESLSQGYGSLIGYRKRDRLFYEICNKFPEFIKNKIVELNEPCREAYQSSLFEQAGYDLEDFSKNLAVELG